MPASVLESLQNDLVDYRGRGLSVLEMSHRSPDFAEIAAKAESDFRQLLNIPDNYSVLFMPVSYTHLTLPTILLV